MATRAKKTTSKRKTETKAKKAAASAPAPASARGGRGKKASAAKKEPVSRKAAAAKKAAPAKKAAKPKRFPPVKPSTKLSPKASKAVRAAADALWDIGVAPHELLKELHEVLLLRCLSEAQGNYASAAKLFGPSRQSVQQYANSELRDERWQPYQQNQRRA